MTDPKEQEERVFALVTSYLSMREETVDPARAKKATETLVLECVSSNQEAADTLTIMLNHLTAILAALGRDCQQTAGEFWTKLAEFNFSKDT